MESIAILREHLDKLPDSDREFALSLLDQARRRGLSARQAEWIDKLAARACEPQDRIMVAGIMEFFEHAALLVRRPHLTIRAASGIDLRLSVAGIKSRTPGHIVVTSPGPYVDRLFYGRIGDDGVFGPSLRLDAETKAAVVAALRQLADDPAGMASAYGHITGHCAFCDLPLSDARSLEVGYGARCAVKYALPWGRAAA